MGPFIETINVDGVLYGFNKITGEIMKFDSEKETQSLFGNNTVYDKYPENLYLGTGYSDVAITIELNSYCNLDCIYCYQTDKGSRVEISAKTIELIIEYISKVYEVYKFHILVLRFIGGEPLLSIDKLLLCYHRFENFCGIRGVALYTHIDTNGTIPFNEILKEIPNLDMVICLSLEKDHNAKRSGSFNRIIKNLKEASTVGPLPIILRYNVAHDNVNSFNDFLSFVNTTFPQIDIVDTARIDDCLCEFKYVNRMTEKSFALWNSSVAINSLIEHGFLITHCTRSALIRCQGYSKYSCKIYADGAVTVCDAMYHDESLLKVDELVHSIDLLCLRYPHIKKYSPITDSFCSICTSIIQCGGRIFCRGKQNPCNYQSEFNEKEFIKTYIRQTLKGNAKYFINMT